MINLVEPWEAAVSLTLLSTAIVFSLRYKLGIEFTLAWASARAAVQLVAVGAILALVIEADSIWLGMVVGRVHDLCLGLDGSATNPIGTRRLDYRAHCHRWRHIGGDSHHIRLGIFDLEPIPLIVVSGITIGNTMPATIQAVDQVQVYVRDHRGPIEAMLALGFDGKGAMRFLVQQVAKTALMPQIERTKVVGLIALPGAMTGLLLGGVEPMDAVLAQLVIMYLVLGRDEPPRECCVLKPLRGLSHVKEIRSVSGGVERARGAHGVRSSA